LNSGTKQKTIDFVTMVQSFQAINENQDAFYLAEHVAKKTGLIQELKKMLLLREWLRFKILKNC
jgi:DNA helicase-2/ATP-dependent DNA helicase PcrA